MSLDQNLKNVRAYIKKERIKVKNVILKNISDKEDNSFKRFDPFEYQNLFYEYELKITDKEIRQILIFLNTIETNDHKTTFQYIDVLNVPLLNNLKKQITNILDKHNLQLKNNWAQLYNKNHKHPIHIHYGSNYSGIIYVEGENPSPTIFYDKYFQLYAHNFKKNTLLMFPSDIPHEVRPLQENEKRLIISFNTNKK